MGTSRAGIADSQDTVRRACDRCHTRKVKVSLVLYRTPSTVPRVEVIEPERTVRRGDTVWSLRQEKGNMHV